MGLLPGTGNKGNGNRYEGRKRDMVSKKLDLTGKFSSYCLTVAAKEAKALKASDELIITCDNLPAATTQIPRLAQEEDLSAVLRKLPEGPWEIRLTRK
jgi:TusA-related sulfurtransferase